MIDKTLDVRFMSEFATNKMKNKTNNFFQFFSLNILKQFFLNLQGATSDRNLRFSYIFISLFNEL